VIAKLKITSIGNSAGVILPKEVLEKMRVEKGDTLFLTETPTGFAVSAFDDEFSLQMSLAEEIMREDRDVLRKLAQ
jgi:putative addiction module antidote